VSANDRSTWTTTLFCSHWIEPLAPVRLKVALVAEVQVAWMPYLVASWWWSLSRRCLTSSAASWWACSMVNLGIVVSVARLGRARAARAAQATMLCVLGCDVEPLDLFPDDGQPRHIQSAATRSTPHHPLRQLGWLSGQGGSGRPASDHGCARPS